MRITERVLNLEGILFFIFFYLKFTTYLLPMQFLIVITFVLGFFIEGIRLHYVIYFIGSIAALLTSIFDAKPIACSYGLIITSIVSWTLHLLYGEHSFRNQIVDGPYGVGYKEVRTIYKRNMLGVYYPMDKKEYFRLLDTDKNVPWFRYGKVSLYAFARATQDYGKDNSLPQWLFWPMTRVKLDAIMDADLHSDFASGK